MSWENRTVGHPTLIVLENQYIVITVKGYTDPFFIIVILQEIIIAN